MARCSGMFLTGALLGALAGAGAIYLSVAAPIPGDQATLTVPDHADTRKLAVNTTLRFGKAIDERDLAGFRASTTPKFQQTFSLPVFEQAFQGFIDQRVNLLAVTGMDPVFEQRTLDLNNDTLRLTGWFPTQPSRLSFDYSYTRVDTGWRLRGIDIKVAPR